jgi:hypothetical protein
MKRFPAPLALCLAVALPGCASRSAPKPEPPPKRLETMEHSPLSDFNIGGGDIPLLLQQAVTDTYRKPSPLTCEALAEEVTALDVILGPDLDTLKAADVPEEFAETALVSALRGLVPYSGVLRLITGAKARQRQIAEALAAGTVRRGYLKGVGETLGCALPAAPRPAPAAAPPLPDAVVPVPAGARKP